MAESDEELAIRNGQNIQQLKDTIKELEEELQSALPPKVRTDQCDAEIAAANAVIEKGKRSDQHDDEQIAWYRDQQVNTANLVEEALKTKIKL